MPHDPKLVSPARNNYFYGKLLDVTHFQQEQRYFNRKRWLMNQLGLGAGVLCGLDLVLSDSGQQVWIQPGVAVDPQGHEIIVPGPYCLENPRQPTDEWGKPEGDPIAAPGLVTICLGYHECKTDPVPALVGDCDSQDESQPSTIRERYRVWVHAGEVANQGSGAGATLNDEQCATLFPRSETAPGFDRRRAICTTLGSTCPEPERTCVVLGTISFSEADDGGETLLVEKCRQRTTLYSNAMLFEMLLCLADRVDACCQVRQLRFVAGDGQSAQPDTILPEPLVVEVVDGEGSPVSDYPVGWRIRAGGGSLSDAAATTGGDGRASAKWALGPAPGHNKAEAYLESGASVIFDATGINTGGPGTVAPPVVTDVWLPNATELTPGVAADEKRLKMWQRQPRIELTFDQEMNEAQLNDPSAWLRLWQLQDRGEIVMRFLKLKRVKPQRGQRPFTVAYALEGVESLQPARYLIQMRPSSGNIVSATADALLLDADFAGTRLSRTLRRKLWPIDDERIFGDRKVWDSLVDTGKSMPSGNGEQGGEFHGWFGIGEAG